MPGAFHLRGKAAFAKDMQNDAFVANPIINPSRMTLLEKPEAF
jgi:hypothetical protein